METAPAVVIRPIELPLVNQRAPSGPAVIPCGLLMPVLVYVANDADVVMRPIESSALLNQSAPSAPGAIPVGETMLGSA